MKIHFFPSKAGLISERTYPWLSLKNDSPSEEVRRA